MDGSAGVGARTARVRKLAGLTQRQLADRAHVSLSLLRKVEQGDRPGSPGFIAAVARALSLSPADLYGLPYGRETPEDHRVHAVIPALRRELAAYRLPPEPNRSRPLPELSAAVAHASRLRHSATLDTLGAELPGLLAELRTAVEHHTGRHREHLFALLAEAYAAAGQVCWKLGYSDLSSLCTERIEWAARQSSDPLAMAAADFYRAGELIAAAEWRGTLAFLDSARDRIANLRSQDEAAIAMNGVLHLKSGLAAARAGDAATSDAHLAEARHAAQHVAAGSDHYRLAFDMDSVSIWSVGLAVERLDGAEAIKRAARFTPSSTTPRERAGHHWIDLARGHQLNGDRDDAFHSLRLARQAAPLQTRYNPQVHETVRALVRAERRRSDKLASYAMWAGVQA